MDSATGEVSKFQMRTELYGTDSSMQIWTFRLERLDDKGNRLPPIPVEMRGLTIEGIINEGDKVEVSGSLREGLFVAESARNLTTNSPVTAKGAPKWLKKLFLIAFIIVLILFLILMGSALVSLL